MNPDDLKEIEKLITFAKDKDLAIFDSIEELIATMDTFRGAFDGVDFSRFDAIKGEKGDKGEQGERGERGPVGPQGPRGKDGKDGRDGRDGRDGEDGEDGLDGRTPVRGVDYFTSEDVADIISATLQKVTEQLGDIEFDAKQIKNINKFTKPARPIFGGGAGSFETVSTASGIIKQGVSDIKFTGAGVTVTGTTNGVQVDITGGGGGSTLTAETPTGTVNGTNTSFTVLNEPEFIVVDGMHRISGNGYTYAGGTITVDSAAPPVDYIVSYYNS